VKVPWKAVLYAVILLFLGSCLLIAGCLIGNNPYRRTSSMRSSYSFWALAFSLLAAL
jgi:hypothetical protein